MIQPLHHIIGKLAPPVFVHNSLIIHSARPCAEPLVADSHVAALPDKDTAAALLLKHACNLVLQRLCLVLLRPFTQGGRPVTVNRPGSDFRHEKRLPASLAVSLNPIVNILHILRRRRVMIPFRVQIIGNDFRQPEADIRLKLTA